jgi:hypothetical protein
MTPTTHVDREDLMAWLDAEVPPVRELEINAHVATCVECQSTADDLRAVSTSLAAWRVEAAPPALVMPGAATVAPTLHTSASAGAVRALAAWLRYYRSVETMLDEVVVADFEQVTQDFGAVIDAVNVRFSTAFDRFDPTPEAIRACFSWIEGVNRERYGIILERAVARPSSTREGLKEAYRQRVRSVRCAAAMGEATKVYDHLLERAHTQLMAARPA